VIGTQKLKTVKLETECTLPPNRPLGAMNTDLLSDDKFIQRGNALFESEVRPHLPPEAEDHTFVAIDVQTGAYALADRDIEAIDQLVSQHPDAEGRIWLRRIGTSEAYHLNDA